MRRFAVVLIALLIAGCAAEPAPPPSVAVGARAGADSSLPAHLYAAALRFYGSPAHVQPTPDPLAALDSGEVDVVPALTGEVLARFAPDAPARSARQVYRAMVGSLPEGLSAGDYADTTSDKPALALTARTAADWEVGDVAALVGRCGTLVPGAAAGDHPPTALGTCTLPEPREFPDSAAVLAALRAGKVNVAWTSTAVPDLPDDLTVLSDSTALIRAENVVPLFRRNTLTQLQLRSVNELAGVLDTDALADMQAQVDAGADPAAVATAWLDAHPIGR